MSLPLRKCGLKLITEPFVPNQIVVTSLAEVWIETRNIASMSKATVSLPLRKCGLKPM